MGYFGGNAAATDRYTAVAPYRAYDSRASSPLTVGETRAIATGLPAGTTLAVLNITATGETANGYFAAGGTGASILNYQTGVNIANLAFVPVSGGSISLYSSAQSHAIIDVLGYFSASGTLQYTPIVQQRLTNYVPVYPGTAYDTAVAGVAGIPATAQVVFNLTGNSAAASTWMVSYASTSPMPAGSTLNVTPGLANNNLSISALGTDGKLRTYNSLALVYMYLDVSGYFS